MDDPTAAATTVEGSLSADSTVGADSPTAGPAADQTAESRHETVAQAAYFLAQARGFEQGHELEDWLAAERQIAVP